MTNTMSPELSARIEAARESSGRFGYHAHSAPESLLAKSGYRNTREVTVGVAYTLTGVRGGLLRRRRDETAYAFVPVRVREISSDLADEGDNGERIESGQAYLPVQEAGRPVRATDEVLARIGRSHMPAALQRAASPAEMERALYEVIRPHVDNYLIINGDLWVRASQARR